MTCMAHQQQSTCSFRGRGRKKSEPREEQERKAADANSSRSPKITALLALLGSALCAAEELVPAALSADAEGGAPIFVVGDALQGE